MCIRDSAAAALDWLEKENFDNSQCWISGFSFGSLIAMQLLMRRPEINRFVAISPQPNVYDFSFKNDAMDIANVEPDTLGFAWVSGNMYLTIQKSIFKLGIPFLAKAKLYGGLGLNQHTSTPFIDQDMMESFVTNEDGETDLQNGEFDSAALEDYLADNLIESSGLHFQAGLQLRLLTFDVFTFYRYTMASDVIPDANGFSSLNFRLGLGI